MCTTIASDMITPIDLFNHTRAAGTVLHAMAILLLILLELLVVLMLSAGFWPVD